MINRSTSFLMAVCFSACNTFEVTRAGNIVAYESKYFRLYTNNFYDNDCGNFRCRANITGKIRISKINGIYNRSLIVTFNLNPGEIHAERDRYETRDPHFSMLVKRKKGATDRDLRLTGYAVSDFNCTAVKGPAGFGEMRHYSGNLDFNLPDQDYAAIIEAERIQIPYPKFLNALDNKPKGIEFGELGSEEIETIKTTMAAFLQEFPQFYHSDQLRSFSNPNAWWETSKQERSIWWISC